MALWMYFRIIERNPKAELGRTIKVLLARGKNRDLFYVDYSVLFVPTYTPVPAKRGRRSTLTYVGLGCVSGSNRRSNSPTGHRKL